MGFKKGNIPWNKDLTKETDERLKKIGKKISKSRKGIEPWNKGLTKETDERVRKYGETIGEVMKGRIPWNKGIPTTEEQKRKQSESMKEKEPWNKGKKASKETRQKMSESRLKRKQELGYLNSPEIRKKISESMKEKEPWNKGLTKETDKRIEKLSDAKKKNWQDIEYRKKTIEGLKLARNSIEVKAKIDGINHWNYNPNRAEVYAPYGKNFFNSNIRNRKWNLQNGQDLLTGTMLDPDKRPAYHHIDYHKSNDDPDNHCYLSCSNHMRITGNRSNPIKSERYKKILQENTLALKNGEIPKYWSQINKELFRQEKLKQLDLRSYII